MSDKRKRVTFEASPDMVGLLDEAQAVCHGRTRSETIKMLLVTGLAENRNKKGEKEHEHAD